MVTRRASHAHLTDSPWSISQWSVRGQSVDSPWGTHGLSVGYPWIVRRSSFDNPSTVHGESNGTSADRPLVERGHFAVSLWTVCGLCPGSSWGVHEQTVRCLSAVRGASSDSPRTVSVVGLPMDTPRTAHGRRANGLWTPHGLSSQQTVGER